jgi:hypothetical protein
MKKITFMIALAMMVLISLTGCHKVDSTIPTAFLGLHMHTSIDSNQIGPGAPGYRDSLGRLESLSLADLYVTRVSLRNKSTQQWYTIPNSIILKRIDNDEYPIGNVPAGTYDAVQFTVGLGNALNSQGPSYYMSTSGLPAADSVLSTTEQAVMWGSMMNGMSATSGYTFVNVQGYDSTDHTSFSYQIGGYGDTVQVILPGEFTLAANQPQIVQYIHIIADYGKLLQNINLSIPANANSSFYGTSPATANSLLNNIIRMFRYECSTPNGTC